MAADLDGTRLQELKTIPNWVLWRLETNDKGRLTKVPFQPSGRKASSTNPKTWSSFDKVVQAHKMHVGDGIGFVFTRDSFSGVDLDHCRDKTTGEIDLWALNYLDRLDSYPEISPSGEGIHCIVKGSIPEGRKGGKKAIEDEGENAAIEIYSEGRFFTVTGHHLEGYPLNVEDREAELRAIYNEIFGEEELANPSCVCNNSTKANALSDDEIICLASEAKNSKKFLKLMAGQWTGDYPSESEADAALAAIVGFYTKSQTQIVRIIRRSKLWDDKWEREDYQNQTVGGALRLISEHYEKGDTGEGEDETGIEPPFTEGGNATRLIQLHGKDLRYCHTSQRWLAWNGSKWTIDHDGRAMRCTEDVIQELYRQASTEGDAETRTRISKFARSQDRTQIYKNILALASNREPIVIHINELDTDRWLLGASGATIDLKTVSMREPRREDFITKTIGARYDPEAQCILWIQFLEKIFNHNQELIKYIQRCVGYTLTGFMGEQVFFFCYGGGDNGKSKFLAVLRALLGEYSKQTDFTTFLVQRNISIRNDLAALTGVRLVTALEAKEGSRLDMQVIKQWTGEDPITARFLHQEYFTYNPEGKLWFAANIKPIISEQTLAAWKRVHLIPFTVTIPENEQDKQIEVKLVKELSGILNWALEGLKEYNQIGLHPPQDVIAATEKYRQESDSMQAFIAEVCDIQPLAFCKNTDLGGTYENFCAMSGYEPLSQRKFSEDLRNRPGVRHKKTRKGVYWYGIGLNPEWKSPESSFECDESEKSVTPLNDISQPENKHTVTDVMPLCILPHENISTTKTSELPSQPVTTLSSPQTQPVTSVTPEKIDSQEIVALSKTYERMIKGKMEINSFSLADMIRAADYPPISPARCKSWLDQLEDLAAKTEGKLDKDITSNLKTWLSVDEAVLWLTKNQTIISRSDIEAIADKFGLNSFEIEKKFFSLTGHHTGT